MSRQLVFGEPGDTRVWVKCANAISERVTDGRYPAGEWLPELSKITAELGTSASAVGKALREAAAHGVVTRVGATGYYAGPGEPPPWPTGRTRMRTVADQPSPGKPGEPPGPREALLSGEQYVTAHELAALLHTSPMTVYRLVKDGALPGTIRITERLLRIPASSARAFLERSLLDPAQLDINDITEADGQ